MARILHFQKRWYNVDWFITVPMLILSILGLINLYSATYRTEPELYLTQLYWIFFGAILGGVFVVVDYRYLEKYGYLLYGIGNFLLLLVLIIGKNVNGSQRWISLGSIAFQPSEPTKLMFVIALSKYLTKLLKYSKGKSDILKDVIIPFFLVILPVVLILKEPDLGTALIYILVFFSIMFVVKLSLKAILFLILIGILTLPLSWNYLLKPYQKERILSFLSPEKDPLGTAWHSRQSIIAIGSGRFTGKGFKNSTQNQFRFMPAQPTDFPFSLLAEEFGFLGASLTLLLYFILILWTLKIARYSKDNFASLTAIGIGATLFWHVVINVGMASGLLPIVGVTLPLISYGGSSVLTVMISLGILINISNHRNL